MRPLPGPYRQRPPRNGQRNLAITALPLTGEPASPPPCATMPAARPAAANDHELLADNFAGALAVIGLHFYQMA